MTASDYSDVFISYRRKNVDFAKQLVGALQDTGKECWVDWEDIPPGSEGFTNDIKRGLEGADAFLCVLSPDYLESTYCVDMELGYALELKKKIIPVVYQRFEGQDVPPGIGHINWIYFTPHAGHENTFDESMPKVLQALDQDLHHAREHKRIGLRAIEWNQADRNNSLLLNGSEIDDAEAWLHHAAGKTPEPTDLQIDYITASRKHEARTQQRLVTGLLIGLVIASVLTVASLFLFREANIQRATAQDALNIAEARGTEVAAEKAISEANLLQSWETQARFLLDLSETQLESGMYHTALLTALASLENYPAVFEPESYGQVYEILANPVQESTFMFHGAEDTHVIGAAWDDSETRVLTWADDFTVRVWDAATSEQLFQTTHDEQVRGANWTAADDAILSWSDDDTVRITPLDGDDVTTFELTGSVLHASLNADESLLLAYSANGQVVLFDVATGDPLLDYNHDLEVRGATLLRDGAAVVSWSEDGTIRQTDVATGAILSEITAGSVIEGAIVDETENRILTWTLDGRVTVWRLSLGSAVIQYSHDATVLGAAWNADETRVFSWGEDETARVYDIRTSEEIVLPHDAWVAGARFDQNERRLMTWDYDGNIRLWPITAREQAAALVLQRDQALIFDAVFSTDEQRILANSAAGVAFVWDISQDLPTVTELRHGFGQSVGVALWDQDQDRVLTTSVDGSARIWDLNYVMREHVLAHQDFVQGATWGQDNSRVLTWSNDSTARIWQAGTKAEPIILPHEAPVAGARFNADETQVLTWAWDGTVALWSTDGEMQASIRHPSFVQGARFGADETQVLSWSQGGDLNLWDTTTGEQIIMQQAGPIIGARFNADETHILAWGRQDHLALWDAATGQVIHQLTTNGAIGGAAFSADEGIISAWGINGTIYAWDTANGDPLYTAQHDAAIKGAVWSADKTRLLSWSNDNTVREWNVATGEETHRKNFNHQIGGALYDQAETRVLLHQEGGTNWTRGSAYIWDMTSDEITHEFIHPRRPIRGARWGPEEARVLTWSWDNTVRVWQLDGEKPPLRLQHQNSPNTFEEGIWYAALSDDGRQVLSVPSDGTARLWVVDVPTFIEMAQSHTIRDFYEIEQQAAFLASQESQQTQLVADAIATPQPRPTDIPILIAGTQPATPLPPPTATPARQTVDATITTDNTPLMTSPLSDALRMRVLPAGAQLTALASEGAQAYVNAGELYGWVDTASLNIDVEALEMLPSATDLRLSLCDVPDETFAATWALHHWQLGCAENAPQRVLSTAQPYVNGIMTWRSDTRSIFVILHDGRWAEYEDTFRPGDELACSTPYTALGFGKLYCSNPQVQALLGPPIGPERTATLVVQVFENGSILQTINTGRLALLRSNELRFADAS
jgi:WD40 repeat protein